MLKDTLRPSPSVQISRKVSLMQIHAKTAKLCKRVWPSKCLSEKSCETKGGGHDMATMVWMIMNLHCSQPLASQLFFTQAF